MAPGVGGNGGGNRQTGTVPKTKSRNESSREYNGTSRRDYQHFNHMPNNLSSLDWQPVNDSLPHPRTRKESNTSVSRYSEFDTGEENTVSQDNLWFNGPQRSQAYHSDDDEVSQASWADGAFKSNNLGLPDKAQVATRLHQIRDYVSQTESLMEGLRASGGQEDPEGFVARQVVEPSRERAVKSVSASPKISEAARKNELKKQVQLSQIKLQELQEQQMALKALRQKAQEQLKEAREAQGALLVAHHGINQQAPSQDNMIHDRLQNLQRFFDARDEVIQMLSLVEGEGESAELQSKLDELHAKKQYMDQLLVQFSNLNQAQSSNLSADDIDECETYVDSKIEELNAMSNTLARLQVNLSSHVQARPSSQERVVKKEPTSSVEKSNSALRTKSQQLNEAREKLQQLQSLLQTVEELRETGQPIPDSILQMMNSSDQSSSPTHPDRSDLSSQEMNLSQPVSEQLVSASQCERSELYPGRGCRSLNSCERERVNHQQPANAPKHNNQERKLGTKMQLEELMRNQEVNLSQPSQSSSFNESGLAGAWGSSSQGAVEDNFSSEFQGDLNESASLKNSMNSGQSHNIWRKPSSASGTSRFSWSGPYASSETRPNHNPLPRPPPIPHPLPSPTLPQRSLSPSPAQEIPQQPDNHWIVLQINQLQSQLQQMTGLYKNFVEKQHNCASTWLPPNNISAALGPYCQYIASASQWQQQQLLVHSLNQCCQLIWHQQRELSALKEALRLLQHAPHEGVHFSVQPAPEEPSASHSNLSRSPHTNTHTTLKPTLSVPAVVSSAHSLPNLASPQTTPASPTPPCTNNRNILSSPHSLPPSLNNTQPQHNFSQFTDPNFINFYPPYGNNLNFEFPSPVNFFPTPPEPFLTWATALSSQAQPTTTLNNQVPPGNRANNYWDNFRSYSRQNLLSNSAKSNDGLPQRTPMERFLNTDPPTHSREQPLRSRKERLNAQCRHIDNMPLTTGSEQLLTRALVHSEPVNREIVTEEADLGDMASGFQALGAARQQVYSPLSSSDSKPLGSAVRLQTFSPHSFQHNVCNDIEPRPGRPLNENDLRAGTRLVNDCESPRGANKKLYQLDAATPSSERKLAVNKRNYTETTGRESRSVNNHQTESSDINSEMELSARPPNQFTPRVRRNLNAVTENVQHNCIGDGYCLMASEKGVRRKDNKGNNARECKSEVNKGSDTLEECVYSEVAALISSNEWRPQFLLQLFKDLRLLSSRADPHTQAALSSIHMLAATTAQDERGAVNEEVLNDQSGLPSSISDNSPSQQPRNWSQKEATLQLPANCAKLDWEVRNILVEMLPFIKSRLGELCGPLLMETLRKLILHLVPSQSTQDQLDAQLEDALHKFHGCRLGDVYEELLIVVADVLISELTFLRLINTVNHSNEQGNAEEGVEEEEMEDEEGAVGGVVEEIPSSSHLVLHPANQTRRTKSETVSEADLAEADQSRHTNSAEEEERGETAEGIELLEEEAVCQNPSSASGSGAASDLRVEMNWTVEQDREMGLDQVPTRLHNPSSPETLQESLAQSPSGNSSNPSDPGPI